MIFYVTGNISYSFAEIFFPILLTITPGFLLIILRVILTNAIPLEDNFVRNEVLKSGQSKLNDEFTSRVSITYVYLIEGGKIQYKTLGQLSRLTT